MDTIISFAKENYDLIVLVVAALGVLISIFSVVVEIKKKRQRKGNGQ